MDRFYCSYQNSHCQYNEYATAEGGTDCDEACEYLKEIETAESPASSGQSKSELLCLQRNEIANTIQTWIDHAENELYPTTFHDEIHIMQFPVYPTAGTLRNWIKVLRAT